MCCIALVRCVLVLRCGLAGVEWYPYAGWSTASACIRIPQCQWKIPVTPSGIKPATFRFVAQYLNHCATAVPIKVKVHGKFHPVTERAVPEREQRYRSIFPLTSALNLGGWLKPDPCHFSATKDQVPVVRKAGRAPGPVWAVVEYFTPIGIRSPDRPARRKLTLDRHRPKWNYSRSFWRRLLISNIINLYSVVSEMLQADRLALGQGFHVMRSVYAFRKFKYLQTVVNSHAV